MKTKRTVCILLAICMILSVLTTGTLATGQADSTLPFTDVSPSAWYHSAVRYVYQREIMRGISPTTFDPNGDVSRAMVAASLFRSYHGRSAGVEDSRENPFDDVPASAWFAPYVSWAYSAGIVDDIGGGHFAPHNIVTREQFATMLHRYAAPNYWVSVQMAFQDTGEWSDWAADALHWTVSHGILRGTSDGLLNARGNVNRAECATMLMRFLTEDISRFLWSWLDDVRHLFGDLEATEVIGDLVYHSFYSGLIVAVTEPETLGGMIVLVHVSYGTQHDPEQFHFWDINGLSTVDEVRTVFENLFDQQPDYVEMWDAYPDKVLSYTYLCAMGSATMAEFRFDRDGTVMGITFQEVSSRRA